MNQPSHSMDKHILSQDTLFAQSEWVQGMVRAMVRDEHLAQDIAQDAMEAGLHAGSKKIRDPRAWLMGVVRNLHRQDARTGVRRRTVEQRKQHKLEEPSSEELLARLEVQQIVAQAVMELPDPFRSVLILRFYEGAPIRTVAVRRGIDRTKAESQVRRGLTLLHRRLKGRLGDAWAIAVLPLALPATASAMTATVAGLAGAASAKALFSVAVGVLALVGFGLWGFQGGSQEEKSNQVLPAEVAVAAATPMDHLDLEMEVLAESPSSNPVERSIQGASPAIEGAWVLRGSLTYQGDPAAFANVILEIRAGHDEKAPLIQEIPLKSDTHGNIVWAGETPAGPVFVQLQTADSEDRPSRSRGILVAPDALAPQDLQLQFYSWSREIHGVVNSVHGDPIAGARVRTAESMTETDGDGRFHLRAGPFSSSDFVYAQASGFAEVVSLAYFKESAAEIEIVLPEEVLVHGRVVDAHGLPIPGAEVSQLMSRWNSVITDQNGTFELGNIQADGDALELYAQKSGHAGALVSIGELSAGAEIEIEIVMIRGGIIQGRVRDRTGAPVAAAKLHFSSPKQGGPSSVVYSAADGFFRVEGMLPGFVDVRVDRPGFVSTQRMVEMGAGDGQLLELPIQLLVGREIEIIILDADGNPLNGGWAIALQHDDAPLSAPVRTDASGLAVLSDMNEGDLSLEVGRPGYGKVVLTVMPGEQQLEVRLDPIPILRGVVLDAKTGEPVPNFRVQLTHIEAGDDEPGVSGISMELLDGREFESPTGEWEIHYDLEPHHWLGVYVVAEGYTLYENLRVRMPAAGQMLSLVSQLDRGVLLSGIVAPKDGGLPIAGAKVTWVDPAHIPSGVPLGSRNPSTISDAQGRFALGGIPAGDASFIVEHKDWARHLEGPVSLSVSDREKEIRILLEKGAELSGNVLAADGTPMESVRVTATPEGLSALGLDLTDSTDADGEFHIDGLPSASYRIHAEVPSAGLWWTLYLVDGQDIGAEGLEISMRRKGTGGIRGRITGHDSLPEMLAVRAINLDGEGMGDEYGGIATDGFFEINGLTAGVYRVEVCQGMGHPALSVGTQSATIKIADGEVVEVELGATLR